MLIRATLVKCRSLLETLETFYGQGRIIVCFRTDISWAVVGPKAIFSFGLN